MKNKDEEFNDKKRFVIELTRLLRSIYRRSIIHNKNFLTQKKISIQSPDYEKRAFKADIENGQNLALLLLQDQEVKTYIPFISFLVDEFQLLYSTHVIDEVQTIKEPFTDK